MSSPALLSRRDALKHAALAAAALSVPRSLRALETPAVPSIAPSPAARTRGLKLGVATISLEAQPVPTVIAVLQQLGIEHASIFRIHAPFEKGTPEQCRSVVQQFRDAGIAVATTSVVNLVNDEAAVRRAFDNVRASGLSLMTCRPAADALPLVERFVREYDVRLAIHNHGPEDKLYASPYDALALIERLDPRIGLCLDVGHTQRANVDPAEAIRRCAARLHDVHLKDTLAIPGALTDIPTEVGRGQIDIRAILQALIEIRYAGAVAFEYERAGVNRVTGLAESVGYVRGMLAALTP